MAASPALFAAAAAFLPSAPSAAALPQPAKLRLYALFKLASAPPSAPPTPPGPRPAFWSVEQRAKWDAWSAAAGELEADDDGGRARARTAYVELARSVGFDETEQTIAAAAARPEEAEIDLAHLSSDDELDRAAEDARWRQRRARSPGSAAAAAAAGVRAGGGGVGGKTMSTLARRPEEDFEDDGERRPTTTAADGVGSSSGSGAGGAVDDDFMSKPPFSLLPSPALLRAHLLTHPSSLNAPSPTPARLTLLHCAADADLPLAVGVLLELGAERGVRDCPPEGEEEEGMTALEMAQANGFADVVRLLSREP